MCNILYLIYNIIYVQHNLCAPIVTIFITQLCNIILYNLCLQRNLHFTNVSGIAQLLQCFVSNLNWVLLRVVGK